MPVTTQLGLPGSFLYSGEKRSRKISLVSCGAARLNHGSTQASKMLKVNIADGAAKSFPI